MNEKDKKRIDTNQCDICGDFYIPVNRCFYCEHEDKDCTGICDENMCTACCRQSFEDERLPIQDFQYQE